MRNKTTLKICTASLLAIALGVAHPTSLQANHFVPTYEQCEAMGKKITICHATSSEENPYVEETIACEALYGKNGNAGHFSENGTPLVGHENDYVLHEGLSCGFSPSPTSSPTPIAPTPTVPSTDLLTPAPTSSPTPSVTITPTVPPGTKDNTPVDPTPASTPAPSNNDTANQNESQNSNQNSGRQTSLGNDNLQCHNTTFDAVMDVKDNGHGVKDILVRFSYNGATKENRTNENGRAKVGFDQNGNGSLVATAEGYPAQSMYITAPQCGPVVIDPNRGRTEAAAATSAHSNNSSDARSNSSNQANQGQGLGTSSLANTGSSSINTIFALFVIGILMTTTAIYGYSQDKKN